MAAITETSPPMTDGSEYSGVEIRFRVLDRNDPMAVAVATAAGRGTPQIRDRVFVATTFPVERSDGRRGGFRETELKHVDSTNYTGLSTSALLSELKKIHDADQASAGLDQ